MNGRLAGGKSAESVKTWAEKRRMQWGTILGGKSAENERKIGGIPPKIAVLSCRVLAMLLAEWECSV